MSYVGYNPYPKVLYSASGSVRVESAEQHAALGAGWQETPVEAETEPAEPAKKRGRPAKVSE